MSRLYWEPKSRTAIVSRRTAGSSAGGAAAGAWPVRSLTSDYICAAGAPFRPREGLGPPPEDPRPYGPPVRMSVARWVGGPPLALARRTRVPTEGPTR